MRRVMLFRCDIVIVCAVVLLYLYILVPVHSEDFEPYYQTIIDNNIFRPLNWESPQRISAYRLLGTAIATDGSSAKAYIQERESKQFYVVSAGQQVGKMTVRTIAPKRVTLTKSGELFTLVLSGVLFLNPHPSRRTSVRENLPPTVTTKKETHRTVTSGDTADTAREWRKTLEEKRAKIRAEQKRLRDYLLQHENRK